MGSCFSSEGAVVTAARDVEAPLEVLWETLSDVPRHASFMSHIDKVEPLGKKGKLIPAADFVFQEGARWSETGIFYTREYQTIESITGIQTIQDPNTGAAESRTVQINSQLINNEHTKSAHTTTYKIQRNGDNRCQIRSTSAFVPSGCLGLLDFWSNRKRLQVYAQASFEKLLDDFAADAEKRFNETNKKLLESQKIK